MTFQRFELVFWCRALMIGCKAFLRGDLLDKPAHPLKRIIFGMWFCVNALAWQIFVPWLFCIPFLGIFFRPGDPLTHASLVLLALLALGVAAWGVRLSCAILSEHGKSVLKQGNS